MCDNMKRIISIGLIVLMSVQCFYKLGVITYFQLNRTYITQVLCVNKEKPMTMCYGQCFLKKNLNLAEDISRQHSTTSAGKEKIELPAFLVSETAYSFQIVPYLSISNSVYYFSSSSDHSRVPFHPPALV